MRVGLVPHLLSQAEKDRRVKIASELLQIYDRCDDKCLCEIVTGDETWILFFEPEGKENNKVWIGENGARPQITRRSRSVKHILYALFLWPEFQFLNTRLSLVSTKLNKFYLLLLTTIWGRIHKPGYGAWSFTTTPQPTAQPWCRTIWKHKDLKLYHIPRTVQIWHHVTSGWTLLSKSVLVDPNSKPAQLLEERYFNAQTVYLNMTIQEFHERCRRTCWGKSHRSHNQNVVIK